MKLNRTTKGCNDRLPPSFSDVAIYFGNNGFPKKVAEGFYQYYKSKKWRTDKGCPIRNWKVAASNWIWMHQQHKPMTIAIKLRLQFHQQQ